MRLLFLILFGLSLLLPRAAAAQNSKFSEFHTWADLATIYNFSSSFRYDGDYGVRGILTGDNWTLTYVRPSLRYEIYPWLFLHGGAALFYNIFKDADNLPEFRPWVGVRFLYPNIGGFLFNHYFRLELRMFYLKSSKVWDTVLRGRYQLQVRSPHFNLGEIKKIYLLSSIEIFGNLNSSAKDAFADRFRYNIGFGKWILQSLTIELNYLFHKVAVDGQSADFNLDDHVVRLRLFYKID